MRPFRATTRAPTWCVLQTSTALLLLGAVGCNGEIHDAPNALATTGDGGAGSRGDGGDAHAPDPTAFACAPTAVQPAATLRRLTMTQYKNTLRDLAAWALGDSTGASTVMTEMQADLAALPTDEREPVPQDTHGSYRRLDQSLQQAHVDGIYRVGISFGAALTTAARLGHVVGPCATDSDASNDAACITQFIQRFGARALRRPLDADEVTFYQSVFGADTTQDPQAYADVIAVMLNAPQAVYFTEHGADTVPGQEGLYTLSAYELASRLSYQFWDTTPDDALWNAASDGSLLRPDVFAQQVHRVLSDPRARPALANFFADWLKVEDLPALDARNQDPTFHTFAGTDLPGPGLRQEMIDDTLGMVDYYLWQQPGDLSALFTSERSFARTPALARIYGVDPWDGTSEPPAFPPGQRPGLLTRALTLTTGSANTRPIIKGVFIRRQILCDTLPPPPPGANAMPPALHADMTTREVVEQLTQQPGSVCAGCHGPLINPLGFATEDFDSLGRHRAAQTMFDTDGNAIGTRPIDTHSIPAVTAGDTTPSAGAADLTRLIVASGKVDACVARNYFRFTFARWEDVTADGCALETLRQRLRTTHNTQQMLESIALTPQFQRRAFQ